MKKQITKSIVWMTAIFLAAFAGCTWYLEDQLTAEDAGGSLVLLNEIEHLTQNEDGSNPAAAEFEILESAMRRNMVKGQREYIRQVSGIYAGLTAGFLFFVFLFLYFKVLRPFHKLEKYAGQIAAGNLDVALSYERTNIFGAFTWAFDHMRKEILRARKCEEDAVNENKTIIATLSHDIKTPLASIRAYAEGLEADLASDYEQRERYVSVIMKKCDEVTRLTNDLVLHSLSELNRLEIHCLKTDIKVLLEEILSGFKGGEAHGWKIETGSIAEGFLSIDKKRLAQVMENLLGNAGKYASDAGVFVWSDISGSLYRIHVRDYGKGISPEDMPFIFEKFYRGKNAGSAEGSGLGLYIVRYIVNRMDGKIDLVNHPNGLEAVIEFPVLKEVQ